MEEILGLVLIRAGCESPLLIVPCFLIVTETATSGPRYKAVHLTEEEGKYGVVTNCGEDYFLFGLQVDFSVDFG
jgi:hypothetical protein